MMTGACAAARAGSEDEKAQDAGHEMRPILHLWQPTLFMKPSSISGGRSIRARHADQDPRRIAAWPASVPVEFVACTSAQNLSRVSAGTDVANRFHRGVGRESLCEPSTARTALVFGHQDALSGMPESCSAILPRYARPLPPSRAKNDDDRVASGPGRSPHGSILERVAVVRYRINIVDMVTSE